MGQAGAYSIIQQSISPEHLLVSGFAIENMMNKCEEEPFIHILPREKGARDTTIKNMSIQKGHIPDTIKQFSIEFSFLGKNTTLFIKLTC